MFHSNAMNLLIIMLLPMLYGCEKEIVSQARNGSVDNVKKLIEKDPSCVNARSHGLKITALHAASQHGRSDIVTLLLSHGAIVDVTDIQGFTPLMNAVIYNHFDIVRNLLNNGADPNHQNQMDQFPLLLALWQDNMEMFDLLLSKGAKINMVSEGKTLLHFAMIDAKPDFVKRLLALGADPNAKDNEGKTPRDYAMEGLKTDQ